MHSDLARHENSQSIPNIQRNNNFDLLRLIFAYAVVFAHTRELSGGVSDLFLFYSSGWGVDGFFLLSGFLVFRSWQNHPCFPSYFLKRFFRVYPAYITVVLLQCCIMVALQWRDTSLADIAKYVAANAVYRERIPAWGFGVAFVAAIGVLLGGLGANSALNLIAKDVLLASCIMIAAFFIPRVRISRDIFFTVYLTHFPLIQFAVIAGLHSVMPLAAFLAIILVANTALALLLSVCIERPLLSYGVRLAASYKARKKDFRARTYSY